MRVYVCILAAAAAVMLIAAPALPQQIFVWDKDNSKTFVNPEGGGYVGCEYWLQKALTDNGFTYTGSTVLPADISPYDIIFVCLGWC